MPAVRLTVSQHPAQIPPEEALKNLLTREAGMDGSEAVAAVRRLSKGKYVDVTFDLGEDLAAGAFVRKTEALGLEARFYFDEPLSWAGSRPKPWFLKLSLAVLLGFGLCVWFFVIWPHAVVTKILMVVEGLVIVSWLASVDRRPRT